MRQACHTKEDGILLEQVVELSTLYAGVQELLIGLTKRRRSSRISYRREGYIVNCS